jgi:hypothetical protein
MPDGPFGGKSRKAWKNSSASSRCWSWVKGLAAGGGFGAGFAFFAGEAFFARETFFARFAMIGHHVCRWQFEACDLRVASDWRGYPRISPGAQTLR